MLLFNRSVLARASLYLVLIFLCLFVKGQDQNIDGLRDKLNDTPQGEGRIDLLNELANRFYDLKISDSLFHYANLAVRESKAMDYTHGQLAAYTVLGSGYWYISDYEQALHYSELSRQLGMESGDTDYLADNVIAIGLVNSVLGHFEVALSNYLEALSIAEEKDNKAVQSRVLNNIAYLYIATGEDQQAIEPLLKAIELNKVLKNDTRMAVYYNNLGVAYRNLKDYDSAFKHLSTALDYARSTNYQPQIGVVLRSLGETHLQKSELSQALTYANEAIALQRTLSSKVELIRSINLSAGIQLKMGSNQKAIQFANEALSLAKEVGTLLEQANALNTLYQAHQNNNNYRETFKYFSEYHVVKDSLFGQEQAREIGRLESKAELDRQTQENERLLIENELNKAQMGREKARSTTFIIITASLVVLVFGSFYVIRNTQKRNDQIRQQKEALEETTNELSASNQELNELSSFKEGLTNMIAHDMKNSLNSIIGYSANDLQDHRMAGIHQSGQNILNLVLNMLDVQRFEEAKVMLNKRKFSMNELMNEAKDRVQLLANERQVKLLVKPENLPSVSIDGDLIMRVMVNLLTNAIKYTGYGTTVTLKTEVTRENGMASLTTSVTDEGEGIAADQLPNIFDKFWQTEERESGSTPSTGLGLTFCKLAVESHQGRIYAASTLDKGTTISFDLPLSNDAILYEDSPESKLENLNPKEREALSRYVKEIEQLKIYQIQALREVVNRLETEIQTEWSKDIMAAAFEGDQARLKI